MLIGSMREATATAVPSANGLYLGQIVYFTKNISQYGCSNRVEVSPALITRVNSPDHEQTSLALVIFSATLGVTFENAVPYSTESKHGHWSFPREGETPVPIFKDSHDREMSTMNTPGRAKRIP
jgi:hypothetical protein